MPAGSQEIATTIDQDQLAGLDIRILVVPLYR